MNTALTMDEQLEEIARFQSLKPSLQVGDVVQLNEYGEKFYACPQGNVFSVITQLYSAPFCAGDDHTDNPMVDCELLQRHVDGTLGHCLFDSRYLKLVKRP